MMKSDNPTAKALTPFTSPKTIDIKGTLPEQADNIFRISPDGPNDLMPSSGLWPMPSQIAITGRRDFSANSKILTIFFPCISPIDPESIDLS